MLIYILHTNTIETVGMDLGHSYVTVINNEMNDPSNFSPSEELNQDLL